MDENSNQTNNVYPITYWLDQLKDLESDKRSEYVSNNIDEICNSIIQNQIPSLMKINASKEISFGTSLTVTPKYIYEIIDSMSPDNQIKLIDLIDEKYSIIAGACNVFSRNKFEFITVIVNLLGKEAIAARANTLKELIDKSYSELDFIDTVLDLGIPKGNRRNNKLKFIVDSTADPDKVYSEVLKKGFGNFTDISYRLDGTGLYENTVRYALEKDENNFIEDDFIAALYQCCDLMSVRDEFNKFQATHETVDLSKYDAVVESYGDMKESDFAEFMSDVRKVKLAEGIIPEKYCDYLIQQKIKDESVLNANIDKYAGLFKRAFEDKGKHVLQCIDDNLVGLYMITVTPHLEDGILGKAGLLAIQLDDTQVLSLSQSNIGAINTLFHELIHIYQDANIKPKNIPMNGNLYKMLKESIYREEVGEDFYHQNYFGMHNEIDARRKGSVETHEYLQELGFSEDDILIDGLPYRDRYIEGHKAERCTFKSSWF